MPKDPNTPTYDLEELKELLCNPSTLHITERAWDDAVGLGFSSEWDIIKQILKIQRIHFFRTQSSEKKPGEYQDVYKVPWKDDELYIKLRKSPFGKGVIISFH